MLQRRHLTGLSVGFNVADPERDIVHDQRSRRRHVRKAVLRECSIAGFPATPGARITGVRSVDTWLVKHGLEADALEELVAIVKADHPVLRQPSDRQLITAIDDHYPIGTYAAVRSAWNDLAAQLKQRRCA